MAPLSLPAFGGVPRQTSLFAHPLLPAALAAVGLVGFALQVPVLPVIRDLSLPDNDDLMRLVQVLDLVRGQDWFDKVQGRFGPPPGAATHWSRLVDAPLAGGILALRPLVGERLAAGIVAAVWPPILLALYLAGTWFAARRWFGTRAAWLAVLAATQLTTIGLFAPGRVDHHNLQVVAVLGILIAVADPVRDASRAAGRGMAAGLLAALSLAIGIEALPLVALCGAALSLAWVAEDGRAERARLAAFGATLALAAPILYAAETLPSAWLAERCDALSPAWLLLTTVGGAGATALVAAGRLLPTRQARFLAVLTVGAIAAAPFAVLFGGCVTNPLGDLSEVVRRDWLGQVAEALPLRSALKLSPEMVVGGILPLAVAALVAGANAARAPRESRSRDLALAAFLGLGAAMACVQLRGIYIASAALPLVAGPALGRAFRLAASGARPGRVAAAFGLAFAMLGKVAALPVLALQSAGIGTHEAAISRQLSGCAEAASLRPLADLPAVTILAPIDLGTAILLHTPHRIVAAPYHREAKGIEAALRAFSGPEADLLGEVRANGAAIVALCRSWTSSAPESFAYALASGAAAPWLAPLAAGNGDLMAWRVVPAPSPK